MRGRDGRGRLWRRIALCTLGLVAACGDPVAPPEPITALPRALSTSEVDIIEASNGFARDLLGQVHSATPDSTVFLSPLSLSMALGMTVNGADGDTRDQMLEMLGFGTLPMDDVNTSYRDLMRLLTSLDPSVEVGVANAAFHRDNFSVQPTFTQTLSDYFDATVRGLDFDDPRAASVMNGWARDQTRSRVQEVIEPPLDPDLVLVLMNAVYFNGDWTRSFDPRDSYDGPFAGPSAPETVRFMTKEDSVGYRASTAWEAVELAYGGGAWTMVLALPLSGATLADVVAGMDDLLDPDAEWGAANVTLHMPRFELTRERLLNDDLRALGMVDAFRGGFADFSGINPDEELVVDFVKQNTFLRVDEVGTEAAAVTTVGIVALSGGAPPDFRADRPFFLAIRERLSGTVLFAGLIVEAPAGD